MKTDEIRASFLEFFRARDHVIERSDLIVPGNDPTLLFTSAGMVQFKQYYSGEAPLPYRRAATSQKCLRAGGKANDLDEVGKTSRHLTFFEMLGNFSFGDYFKEEAITWAWEYVTEVLRMDGEKVWVSVFENDDEAEGLWTREIGIPAGRIARLGAKDNFWGPAGETGACGPCSELYIDRGEERGCGRAACGPGCDYCERFLEFWNLVFPQFDQQADGSRLPLKNRGIDTGMGMERLAAILQGKETVFDTDGLAQIIRATESLTRVPYADNPVPYRVIADHVRALSFMIADGILPSNEGRGYVQRRLLRRAARFGLELGLTGPFLHEVSRTVIDLMGPHYPELVESRVQIDKILLTEEERFAGTLARGMELLEGVFADMAAEETKVVPGATCFKLHDTYGFPLDLASDIAEDKGYTIDRAGFERAMQKQKEQARGAWAGSGQQAILPVYRAAQEEHGPTRFVGYDATESAATIVALVHNGQAVDELRAGEEGEILLDQTPFYAESGGQVGDTGSVGNVHGNAAVTDTRKIGGKLFVHSARVNNGVLRRGEQVEARVDAHRRGQILPHHTATHLLQAALQQVLGSHVHQAGSLVAPGRLRFDFTHFESIDLERLLDVERLVNEYIRRDAPVEIAQQSLEEARAAGAMALFGEKYEDVVRVVTVGDFSKELCGGTHVPRTGTIGYFKILSESSVSSGVRRIEAVCGEACIEAMQGRERQLHDTARALNAPVDGLDARVRLLIEENRRLARETEKWKQSAAAGGAVDYMSRVRDVQGVKVIATAVDGLDAEGLRMALDSLRDKIGSGVIVLGSGHDGKVSLCVGVTADLVKRIKAGDIVKQLAPIVGGGGGGRADMAQAGGKWADKLPDAIARAAGVIETLLA